MLTKFVSGQYSIFVRFPKDLQARIGNLTHRVDSED